MLQLCRHTLPIVLREELLDERHRGQQTHVFCQSLRRTYSQQSQKTGCSRESASLEVMTGSSVHQGIEAARLSTAWIVCNPEAINRAHLDIYSRFGARHRSRQSCGFSFFG